ncbi:hypothetical protein HZA97_01780 [Candidatus Woesearchaeota archaeon]|nr:hypothetical protein [Candidatus Woesearchaeota archaeon]
MIKDLINLVVSILSIVCFLVVIYMILLKLTGHSPTLDEITVALSVGIGIMVINIFYTTGKFSSSIEHIQEDIKELKLDLKEFKKETSSKFEKINKDLTIIKTKLFS